MLRLKAISIYLNLLFLVLLHQRVVCMCQNVHFLLHVLILRYDFVVLLSQFLNIVLIRRHVIFRMRLRLNLGVLIESDLRIQLFL